MNHRLFALPLLALLVFSLAQPGRAAGELPAISGFSPAQGPAGTLVEIRGNWLSAVTAVSLGSTPAPNFQIVSGSLIRVEVPAGAASAKFTLTTPQGTVTSPQTFSVGENSVPFTLVDTPVTGLRYGAVAPADYDSDGRLDFITTGHVDDEPLSLLYHQGSDGGFALADAALQGIDNLGAASWGDIDNDNDLDLLLTGNRAHPQATPVPITVLYRNDGGTFTPLESGLPALLYSAAAFGDLDSDGDLDLALSGQLANEGEAFTGLFLNDGAGGFTPVDPQPAELVQLSQGTIDWVDVDNDTDLDLFISGMYRLNGLDYSPLSLLYINEGGGLFSNSPLIMHEVYRSASDWGDYDNDGDMDLLLAGQGFGDEGPLTIIYRNDGGKAFVPITTGMLPFWFYPTAAWGDYDNDGDLDALLYGPGGSETGWMPMTIIYKNDAGTFTNANVPLEGSGNSQAAWADVDNDHDLDLLINGDTLVEPRFFLYRNEASTANTPPAAPTGLNFFQGNGAVLQWQAPADDHTPSIALTYNLRVGTTPGGTDVLSPSANLLTGQRYLLDEGNAGQGTAVWLGDLEPGTYYWAVQAVDTSLAASPFSAEGQFTVLPEVTIRQAALTVNENQPYAVLEVALSGPSAGPVSVDYATSGLGAVAGNDFMPASGTLTFAPGQVSKTIQVEIFNDAIVEPDEDFLVSISNVTGDALLGEVRLARVTIADENGFEPTGDPFPGVSYRSASAWGDYDSDGDLDLVLSSRKSTPGSPNVTRIYRNDNGSFTDIYADLPGMDDATYIWFDADNDSDLDLLLYGRTDSMYSYYSTRLYRNTDGVFSDTGGNFLATGMLAVATGDYDNDGDTDLLLGNSSVTILYENKGGSFYETEIKLPVSTSNGPFSWGDYDNDGDLDLAMSTSGSTSYPYTQPRESMVLRNDGGGAFTRIAAPFEALTGGTAAWGDYDNDGYLDLLLSGRSGSTEYATRLYRNNGQGGFSEVDAGLPPAYSTNNSSQWADYDNDGDLDLLLSNVVTAASTETRVYRNDGGSFTNIQTNLKGHSHQPTTWGDFDNDGDLDLLMAGYYAGSSNYTATIYRNRSIAKNAPPAAPTQLSASVSGGEVTLTWAAPTDDHTPRQSLTYNLRVGTYPGGDNIVSPHSVKASGYRQVPEMGNAGLGLSARLSGLKPAMTYYWSVQAVDGALAGSPFAAEGSFTTSAPALSISTAAPVVEEGQLTARFTVTLSPAPQRVVTVKYATADGPGASSATAGSDYEATSGTLTFSPGETVKHITVRLLDDSLNEEDETLLLVLSEPVNATLPAQPASLTIRDDDPAPTVRFEHSALSAAESAGQAELAVLLSAPSALEVTVGWRVTGGTAVVGKDYSAPDGVLTFAPGQTRAAIPVTLLDDTLPLPAVTLVFTLESPTHAVLGEPSELALSIEDDDIRVRVYLPAVGRGGNE